MTWSHSTRLQPPSELPDELHSYRLPDGRPISLFALLAHSEPALADLRGATARALQATTLDGRMREVLILRVLALIGAEAERQVHVSLFAEKVGLTHGMLAALASTDPTGPTTALTPDDQLMIRLAAALCDSGRLDDATWSALEQRLGLTGAIEAVFVGAQYVKVGVMNNALAVAPPFGPSSAVLE